MSLRKWEADSDWTAPTPPCPECGAPTEALKAEPQSSLGYINHLFLCTGKGCRRVWPYRGARRLEGVNE